MLLCLARQRRGNRHLAPALLLGRSGQCLNSAALYFADPGFQGIRTYGLRICTAGPERLEPGSPLSSRLGGVIDWLAVYRLRPVHTAFSKALAAGHWRALSRVLANHLRFGRPSEAEVWSYNVLQRLAYLFVIFFVFPLMIWTGLAMSPAVTSAFPITVMVVGGQQSARTIHFFGTVFLVMFLFVHIIMVYRAGFRDRTRAMITGRGDPRQEHP
jgi:hypothetical protein